MPEIPWWQGTTLTQEQAHAFYYDQEYLEQFEQFVSATITVGGKQTEAIEGVLPGGEKVLLAAQMTNYDGEAVWARISQTEIGGRTMNVFINPDWDLNGAVQVNENTARVIYGWLFQALTEGQFKGKSPESLIGRINNLQLPQCEKTDGNWWPVKWVTKSADTSKPMEIVLLGSKQELAELRQERPDLAEGIMDGVTAGLGRNNPNEPIGGGWLTVGEDGHLILIVSSWTLNDDILLAIENGDNNINIEAQQGFSRYIGIRLSPIFATLGNIEEGSNAFSTVKFIDDPDLKIMFDGLPNAFWQDQK